MADLLTPGDAFIVASEMRGLTQSDGAAWASGLVSLMNDVKSLLPAGVLVSYASDWSEYQETALAPTWSSADFVGIDNYLPLTDWRTLDDAEYSSEAFKSGWSSGEYWDYFYVCLLYTSPSPRDGLLSRMPSSA